VGSIDLHDGTPPELPESGGQLVCTIDLSSGGGALAQSRAAFRFSLFTAALVGILSCEESGGGLSEPTTGTLEVTTATTGVETDPDGYTLQVDSDSPQAIGSAATWQSGNLAEGSHTVAVSGIAANCVVEGENPRTVSITAGETTTVTFAIICGATTGNLRVTAASTGPSPDIDGYTLLLDGANRGAIGPTAETTLEGLTAGAHSIGLAGVAGNCLVEGENPRAVTVTAGGTATADFVVTCQTPPASTGSIHITTTTSGGGIDPDGYQFQIDGSGTQPIASSGEATVNNLAVGPHSVLLAGVASHCSVTGTSPQSVSVTAGGIAEAAFSVTCQDAPVSTGSIQITTTTSRSGIDLDGYEFQIDGGGAQPIASSSEVTVSGLTVGPHLVELSGVAANCVLQGDNPRAVTVTGGATTPVAFEIRCSFDARRLVLATQPSAEAQSGVVLARQPVVQLQAADGSPVALSGLKIQAALLTSYGTLGGSTTRQTDANGRATFTDLLITGPIGEYILYFEALGFGPVTSEAVVIGSSTAAYQMAELDFLPRAINQVGHIVGTRGHNPATARAVIWRDGVSTELGTLGGASSRATAINNQDVVVGSSTTATGEVHGFLWDGTMHDLGPEFVPRAINDAGQMVGSPDGHANTLFRDGDQTVSTGGCNGSGLNNLGQVVGQWLRPVDDEPNVCLWDGEVHDLGMDEGSGSDINEHGSVVGVIDNFPGRISAFYWHDGIETRLPSLGGIANGASAINDGEIVVGHSGQDPENEALYFPVVWKDGTVMKLSQEYGAAHDINNSGWIVGAITPEVGVVPPRGVLWRPLASGN
jgi:probable HAF family extracellular repeat protein